MSSRSSRYLLGAARQARSCQSRAVVRPYSNGSPARASQSNARDWSMMLFGVSIGGLALYLYERREGLVPAAQSEAAKKPSSTIAAKELEKHNSRESLWVAIDGDVYDLTGFIDHHPGGSQVLIDHAGKDVTSLFKGIHPPGTIEKNLERSDKIGRLDPQSIAISNQKDDASAERIKEARKKLFGVDSIVTLDDFEKYAKDVLNIRAWEYFSTGAETETALINNKTAYDRIFFRPRVMVDVTYVDTHTQILGVDSPIPVYVSPTASNALGQPLGEIAVTRGAASTGILQILSHVASKSLDEVMSEKQDKQKVGWQLYMNQDRSKAEEEIKHAVELGAQSIWLTVDTTVLGRRIRQMQGEAERNPAPNGKPLTQPATNILSQRHASNLTWKDIAWIKSLAPGIPVVVKGVGAWEDVVLAKENGADAVVLSNHGGRQLDFAHAPIQTLYELHKNSPDILKDRSFQVFVDGGIRRGTDVLKALCLGASAVGLGRPFIYAATGWGSDGVEKAVQIMRKELEVSMRLLGVTKLDQLRPELLDCSKL
ncbi:L-mandelate dehydrogenase [Naematelia encephala]|uniref:L-mandelate dehydrogenase n=1 Tax=Naematelia encephala TaxID=71784 RepID=A0A1Y2BHV0_9TREE|nr:L-mandelate dehydrogenase [Naematelia encephala]